MTYFGWFSDFRLIFQWGHDLFLEPENQSTRPGMLIDIGHSLNKICLYRIDIEAEHGRNSPGNSGVRRLWQ